MFYAHILNLSDLIEANPWLSDSEFTIAASRMENLKIQPSEQTFMQEGRSLGVGLLLGLWSALMEAVSGRGGE